MIFEKSPNSSGNQATVHSVDPREMSAVEGGWCGTPVPGSFPPVPNPGPDPWSMTRLGDLGRLAGFGAIAHR